MAVRNPTIWTPPSGTGYVVTIGNELLVTNSGNFLVTNSGNQLVTNPTKVIPKFSGVWTQTSKNDTNWVNKTIVVSSSNNISDPSGNLLVDPSGNQIVDTGETVSGKNSTQWTESGA